MEASKAPEVVEISDDSDDEVVDADAQLALRMQAEEYQIPESLDAGAVQTADASSSQLLDAGVVQMVATMRMMVVLATMITHAGVVGDEHGDDDDGAGTGDDREC